MKKGETATFILYAIGMSIYIIANFLTRIPAVREAIATKTFTPIPSIANYQYLPGESPFYLPIDTSVFVPVSQFKNIEIYTFNGEHADAVMLMDGERLLFSAEHLQKPPQYQIWLQSNNPLFCVDVYTGKVLWQSWTNGSDLVKDDNHVLYAQSIDTGADDDPGLVAYEIASGKKLWETRLKGKVGITAFFLSSFLVHVSATNRGDNTSYLLDKTTGEIRKIYLDQKRFVASGAVFSDGIGIKRDGGYGYGPVKGYEIGTGKIIWAIYQEFAVSNIAVSGSVAYFVTLQAHLLAVDIHTGQVVGELAFSPAFDLTKNKYGTPAFDYLNDAPAVAADGDLVTVYFADKKQLSVFRFTAFP